MNKKIFTLIILMTISVQLFGQDKERLLDNSPLSKEELDFKSKINTYTKSLSNEELDSDFLRFYEYKNYDNILTLRILKYIVDHQDISKLSISRGGFVLIVSENFDDINFQENISNTGLNIKPISKSEYQLLEQMIN